MSIDVVVFVVHGQSSSLSDCLDAFADNFAGFGHRPEILVIDSSSDSSDRNSSKESLLRVHRKHGFKATFFSGRECEQYISRGGPDALRYAMKGDWRIGSEAEAAVNQGLLATHGRSALFIDATCRMSMSGAPGGDPCFRVRPTSKTYGFDPYEYGAAVGTTYPNGYSKVPAVRNVDILRVMGDSLGREASSCASDHKQSVGKLKGTVRLSSAGTWGDLNVPYATHYALSDAYGVQGLAQDDESYETVRSSTSAREVSHDWTASEMAMLRSGFFAVSAGCPLMPFLPTGGSSSGFSLPGLLMSLCAPGSLSVEVPWAVRQEVDAKTFSPDSMQDGASRFSLHDLMLVLVDMLAGSGDVGGGLVAASDLPPSDFDALLRDSSRSWARKMCSRVEGRLAGYSGSSDEFRSDMQGLIDTYRQMLENESYRVPYEIRTGAYSFESDRILRRQLRQYGDLLSSWEEVKGYVADLQSEGVGIGVRP